MFKVVENLVSGAEIIRARANSAEEARRIAGDILASGKFMDFSTIAVKQVIK